MKLIIANEVPNFVKGNIKVFLGSSGIYRILAFATVTNIFTQCGLKTIHYKLMPGFTFVGLVTVASFQHMIAPGSLVFTPFLISSILKLATNG